MPDLVTDTASTTTCGNQRPTMGLSTCTINSQTYWEITFEHVIVYGYAEIEIGKKYTFYSGSYVMGLLLIERFGTLSI